MPPVKFEPGQRVIRVPIRGVKFNPGADRGVVISKDVGASTGQAGWRVLLDITRDDPDYDPKYDAKGSFFTNAELKPETKPVAKAKPKKSLRGVAVAFKCVKVKAPLSSFDRRSIRTITRGNTRILTGCPAGQWMPKAQRCKVGTRAYETITPGRCKRGSGGKTK